MSKRAVLTGGILCLAGLALPAGASRQFTSTVEQPSWVRHIEFASMDVGSERLVPSRHAEVKKEQPKKLAKKPSPARAPVKIATRPVPVRAAAAQASAPSNAPFGGMFNINFDPLNWIFNQGLNQLPAPTTSIAGGMVYGGILSAAGNLIYASAKMNITEDRELGHGEACAVVMNSLLNPTPFPLWTKWCIDEWAKHDLCKEKVWRNYPPPERTVVPNEAYDAWYEEKYCNAPPHPEYDVLLKEVGYTLPRLKRQASR